MIVDIRQQHRGHALTPGVITKGFPKGVTADVLIHAVGPGGLLDNAKRLAASQGPVIALSAGKEEVLSGRSFLQDAIIIPQGVNDSLVQCDLIGFSCLLFCHADM